MTGTINLLVVFSILNYAIKMSTTAPKAIYSPFCFNYIEVYCKLDLSYLFPSSTAPILTFDTFTSSTLEIMMETGAIVHQTTITERIFRKSRRLVLLLIWTFGMVIHQ
jgi:hypothetical protein